MSLSSKERAAIKYSETCYTKNQKGFLKRLFKIRFKFKSYDVVTDNNLYDLWVGYGLNETKKIEFTIEDKFNCLAQWYKVLYSEEFDFKSDYEAKKVEFMKNAKQAAERNPHIHFNLSFPNFEKYLKEVSEEIGYYNIE